MKLILFLLVTNTLLAAEYDVPVPSDLMKYARWNLTDAFAEIQNNKLHVRYCLPWSLVGKKVTMLSFSGDVTSDFVMVSGPKVEGVCMLSEKKPVTCLLRYPGMSSEIDPETRDIALEDQFKNDPDPKQVAHRKTVVNLFSADPAGILYVDLKRE